MKELEAIVGNSKVDGSVLKEVLRDRNIKISEKYTLKTKEYEFTYTRSIEGYR